MWEANPKYSEDKSLCVITTIDEYIKRTVN